MLLFFHIECMQSQVNLSLSTIFFTTFRLVQYTTRNTQRPYIDHRIEQTCFLSINVTTILLGTYIAGLGEWSVKN